MKASGFTMKKVFCGISDTTKWKIRGRNVSLEQEGSNDQHKQLAGDRNQGDDLDSIA